MANSYVANFRQCEWIDLSEEHRVLREELESAIRKACVEKAGCYPISIRGEFGIGKSQLLYHLAHFSIHNGVPALYYRMDEIVKIWKHKRGDRPEKLTQAEAVEAIQEEIDRRTEEMLKCINGPEKIVLHLPNTAEGKEYSVPEYFSDFKPAIVRNKQGERRYYGDIPLNSAKLKESLDNLKANTVRALLLIDEVESSYSKISACVEAEGGGPLRELNDAVSVGSVKFHLIMAFGPSSTYEYVADISAEVRRTLAKQIPFPRARDFLECISDGIKPTILRANSLWWLGRGRPGQIMRVHDSLRWRGDESYTSFLSKNTWLWEDPVDAGIKYWNDVEFSDVFPDEVNKDAIYQLLLEIGPTDYSKLNITEENEKFFREHVLCDSKLTSGSVLRNALLNDLAKNIPEQYQARYISDHRLDISIYLEKIIEHISDESGQLAWGVYGSKDARVFRDRILLPMLYTLHAMLALHGAKNEGNGVDSADVIYTIIQKCEQDRQVDYSKAGDMFRETWKLLNDAPRDEIKYIQIGPGVLHRVIEQPVGSPDIQYNNKGIRERKHEVDSPTFPITSIVSWAGPHKRGYRAHVLFIPDLHGVGLAQYLERIRQHVCENYSQGKYSIGDYVLLLSLCDENIPDSILSLAEDLNKNKLWAKHRPVEVVSARGLPCDRPEHDRDFFQSLCLIALVDRPCLPGDNGIAIDEVAGHVQRDEGKARRDQRRAVGYKIAVSLDGDLKRIVGDMLAKYEERAREAISISASEKSTIQSIANEIGRLDDKFIHFLCMLMFFPKEGLSEQAILEQMGGLSQITLMCGEDLLDYSELSIRAGDIAKKRAAKRILEHGAIQRLRSYLEQIEDIDSLKPSADGVSMAEKYITHFDVLGSDLSDKIHALHFIMRAICKELSANREEEKPTGMGEPNVQQWTTVAGSVETRAETIKKHYGMDDDVIADVRFRNMIEKVVSPMMDYQAEGHWFSRKVLQDAVAACNEMYSNRQRVASKLDMLCKSIEAYKSRAKTVQEEFSKEVSNLNVKMIFLDQCSISKSTDTNISIDNDEYFQKVYDAALRRSRPGRTWTKLDPPSDVEADVDELVKRIKEGVQAKDIISKKLIEEVRELRTEYEKGLERSQLVANCFKSITENARPVIPPEILRSTGRLRDILNVIDQKWDDPAVKSLVSMEGLSSIWVELADRYIKANSSELYSRLKKDIFGDGEARRTLDLLNSPSVNCLKNEISGLCASLDEDSKWVETYTDKAKRQCREPSSAISARIENLSSLVRQTVSISCTGIRRGIYKRLKQDLINVPAYEVVTSNSNAAAIVLQYTQTSKQLQLCFANHKAWMCDEILPPQITSMAEEWRDAFKQFLGNLPALTDESSSWDAIQVALEDRKKMVSDLVAVCDEMQKTGINLRVGLNWLKERDVGGTSSYISFRGYIDELKRCCKFFANEGKPNIQIDAEPDHLADLETSMPELNCLEHYRQQSNWRNRADELCNKAPSMKFIDIYNEIVGENGLETQKEQLIIKFHKIRELAKAWNTQKIIALTATLKLAHDLGHDNLPLPNTLECDSLDDFVSAQLTFLNECHTMEEDLMGFMRGKLSPPAIDLLGRISCENNVGNTITAQDVPPLIELREKRLIDVTVAIRK